MVITVTAAKTQEALERDGAEFEHGPFETVKEAKQRAKYYLTEEYRIASESSERLGYAQVLFDGECQYNFFAR
jgi:hypothetical protein